MGAQKIGDDAGPQGQDCEDASLAEPEQVAVVAVAVGPAQKAAEGWRGSPKMVSVAACSTIFPAYMIPIRSATFA